MTRRDGRENPDDDCDEKQNEQTQNDRNTRNRLWKSRHTEDMMVKSLDGRMMVGMTEE